MSKSAWTEKDQIDNFLKERSIKVKEFQRSFHHSDTERLSRSDEVLKLKNFKKDATLKLFKSTNQERKLKDHIQVKVKGMCSSLKVKATTTYSQEEEKKEIQSFPDAGFKPSGDNEKKVTKEPGKEDDDYEDVGAETDRNNLNTFMLVSPIPTTRIHKDHPVEQIIGDLNSAPQTRRMTKNLEEHEDLEEEPIEKEPLEEPKEEG
ncbi:hypothetical protein Tco_0318871 [Tanacetum coccineum]